MVLTGRFCSILSAILLLLPLGAQAFTCRAGGKELNGSGAADVMVTLTPQLQPNENLVVNLGESIQCKNDLPQSYLDPVRIGEASAYSGALANFTGSISYFGQTYPFPIQAGGATHWENHTWGEYQPWNVTLYLKATGAAGGVVINQGELFASLKLEKKDNDGSINQTIIWNLIAANSVIVPTGGCNVSSPNINVLLPDYPGTSPVDLTVHCAQSQNLNYYLTGTTADAGNTIFTNVASISPAQGVGVRLRNSSGILAANQQVSMGSIGTSETTLGLTAEYGLTGPQLTAGNVQSIIEVTFIYP